jgi:hypothetical protein
MPTSLNGDTNCCESVSRGAFESRFGSTNICDSESRGAAASSDGTGAITIAGDEIGTPAGGVTPVSGIMGADLRVSKPVRARVAWMPSRSAGVRLSSISLASSV